MNREIVGGGGAAIYPLQGDVASTAGSSTVTVQGIQGVPVDVSFPTGGEVLTYDATEGTLSLAAPAAGGPTLETNGTLNSTQTLLNLQEGTNITLTESGGTVTINAPTPTGASTIITNFQPGSVFTGTGAVQNIIGFTIAANTVPVGKGLEFAFTADGSTGAFGTNLWNLVINGSINLGWNGITGTSGYASGGFRIVNNNGSTSVNSLVSLPLFQNTVSGGIVIPGPAQTSTIATTSAITVTLTWNGPNTITTQIIQAYLRFI